MTPPANGGGPSRLQSPHFVAAVADNRIVKWKLCWMASVTQITMKTLLKVSSLIVCAVASVFLTGCSSVSLPPAKGYSVIVGQTEYYAKSVKIHGQWIEMETDSGPVWASSAVIKPRN